MSHLDRRAVYHAVLSTAMNDGLLTNEEGALLGVLRAGLRIDLDQHAQIQEIVRAGTTPAPASLPLAADEAEAIYEQALLIALLDQRISSDEMSLLSLMARTFAIGGERHVVIEGRVRRHLSGMGDDEVTARLDAFLANMTA